jgi:hypothetical protein
MLRQAWGRSFCSTSVVIVHLLVSPIDPCLLANKVLGIFFGALGIKSEEKFYRERVFMRPRNIQDISQQGMVNLFL